MISSDLDKLEDVEDDLCSCFAERIFRSSGDCTCQGVYTRHGGGGGSGLSRQRSIRLDCFHFFSLMNADNFLINQNSCGAVYLLYISKQWAALIGMQYH